ncbi:urease accessory UreF family protein [Arthrobacter sp. zg-Y820]|uniref:urease accessory protein UreF n=1 Tax=unclassified Arthrobacter TaxID=235627 RepID=UPI001E568806|nr:MULTISPECIES: urease accessory UreF family protein [unclassified Arthrobacter]MCC9195472.1 urease accessory protein UreF [Arthrobacter sp. zg-Y820]MDK1278331.1 urease accessory UreF family protein [Arthrobacter sp. zg.Y820]WIB10208.1 urease accessory UreF family protein [Arthrobacter sp. zg-Y820]
MTNADDDGGGAGGASGAGESAIAAFLLADSRLPSGAYSHSAGLEPAVMAGLQVDGVYPYLVSRLQTVVRMETSAAVLAHRHARELSAQGPGFAALESALDARTPSAAQREASRRLGRGMLRLAATLKPGDPAVVVLKREAPRPTRPVALGVAAQALGVGERQLARLCCYDDAQSVVAAALKLLPIDPMSATAWILKAEPQINAVVAEALQTQTVDDIPALSAPWMEHWAEDHTERTRRLFVA